jgi:hypothetical protein
MTDFSDPFDVVKACGTTWLTDEKDIWHVAEVLDESRHRPVVGAVFRRTFRLADPVEIAAGKLTVFKKSHR